MQAKFTPFAALLVLLFSGAQCQILIMSNPDVVHVGGDFTIHCQIVNFPLGDTVAWHKRQIVGDGQEPLMDTFAFGTSLVELYDGMGRFSLTSQVEGADVTFILNVKDAMEEDSGEYGCVNTKSDINQLEWKTISVISEVKTMDLFTYENPDMSDIVELEDGQEINIHEGQQGRFKCEAAGSNPSPQLTMSLEDHDLTDDFTLSEKRTLTPSEDPRVPSDAKAMQLIEYTTTLVSKSPLKVESGQGEMLARKSLICSAKVQGHEAVETTAQLVFKVAPKVNCTDVIIHEGGNAKLQCVIRADPPASDVVFKWNSNLDNSNNSIRPGDIDGHFHFRHLEDGGHGGEQVATLEITRAASNTFNVYTLDATNEMGTGTDHAELIQGPGESIGGANHIAVLPSLILVCVGAALFRRI